MGIFRKKDDCYYIGNWYVGWKSKHLCLTYRAGTYDDGRHNINISLFGWHSMFKLPFYNKDKDCGFYEPPEYGISTFEDTLWFRWGDKGGSWDLPFVNYGNCIRWNLYCGPTDGNLEDKNNWAVYSYMVKNGNGVIKDNPTLFHYDYTDPYDGNVVKCKFYIEEQEWRPKWLKWTKRFALVKRSIWVDFEDEMGPRKGSWKGGTMGAGFIMKPNETPMECIKRMEKEYKFG